MTYKENTHCGLNLFKVAIETNPNNPYRSHT